MIALPVHQQLEDVRSAEMTCNIKIMLISKRLTNIDINNQRLRTIYRTCNLLSIRPMTLEPPMKRSVEPAPLTYASSSSGGTDSLSRYEAAATTKHLPSKAYSREAIWCAEGMSGHRAIWICSSSLCRACLIRGWKFPNKPPHRSFQS
ncbi:hypothetical protein V3481_000116 [Fusarium oxysporum f. sp. vasinfectum]